MGDSGGMDGQPDPTAGVPLSLASYLLLVRLAALLTGDARVAEAIAAASCGAVLRGDGLQAAGLPSDGGDALHRLQRETILRSRRAARQRPAQGRHSFGTEPRAAPDPGATDFASLPVVALLRGLPARAREALVLTYYLDLTEQQAAALAGVSQPTLRRHLASALRALPVELPGR